MFRICPPAVELVIIPSDEYTAEGASSVPLKGDCTHDQIRYRRLARVIADEFTKENIRLLMAGLCRLMEKEGLAGAEVCVGYDRRFLSKESAHWAAEVLAGCGFHPFVINRSSPTPLMMFTVKKRGEPYGIAVTASHNPAIYNGIKVFTAGAGTPTRR